MPSIALSRSGRVGLVSAAVAALCLGFTAWRTTALTAPAPVAPPATVVAVVNIGLVLDGLTETIDRQKDGTALIESLKKKLEEVNDQIKTLGKEVESLPKDSPNYVSKKAQLYELMKLGTARRDASDEIISMTRAEGTRAMYLKIMEAVDSMAKKNGYDLVVVNDAAAPPPPPPPQGNEQMLNAYITTRKVAFASAKIDISKDIIDRMNNDYATRGSAGK